MTPVDQRFNDDDPERGVHGDCLRAAVASLFDLPCDEVPHFTATDDWLGALQAWARPRGLCYLQLSVPAPVPDTLLAMLPGHFLLIGQQAGGTRHCVVARGREQVHDPQTLRRGVRPIEDFFQIGIFCRLL